MTREELNRIGKQVFEACLEVHKEMGAGLLESVYVYSLIKELEFRGIKAVQNIDIPLKYKGFLTGKSYEIDILIEEEIIFEAKAVDIMHPVYQAQVISYLKLTGKKLGFLVNFNVPVIKDGFKRIVYNF